MLGLKVIELLGKAPDNLENLVLDRRGIDGDLIIYLRQLAKQGLCDLPVGRDDDIACFRVCHVQRDFLTQEDVAQVLRQLLVEAVQFLLVVVLKLLGLFLGLDCGRLDPLVAFLLGGDFHPHHLAKHARGHFQRGILHVGGLLPEDGPQEAFLGGQLGFALGRYFAHKDVSRSDLGPDPDDSVHVEVVQRLLTKVRDVPGDFLRAKFGVARTDLVLADVDRREHIILDDPFADADGVLKVVTVPRHIGDQHVLPDGQFAVLGARTVSDGIARLDLVSHRNQRLLVDAGAGV